MFVAQSEPQAKHTGNSVVRSLLSPVEGLINIYCECGLELLAVARTGTETSTCCCVFVFAKTRRAPVCAVDFGLNNICLSFAAVHRTRPVQLAASESRVRAFAAPIEVYARGETGDLFRG